ncbi:hypothetical protein AGMMS49936_11620 [Endomicrobiia bacterium]|nr:hypothetical protein AGMMS49936_11620 [Endomicrobiia bacterium]
MICLLSALSEVFVIEWFKNLHKFSSGVLSTFNLLLAIIGFGIVGWKALWEHIKEERLGKWIVVIMIFLNLGFSQMIYANYSKLCDIMVAILNKCASPNKDGQNNAQINK